ncbi:toprim domain-containing protein [Methylolobus aquaticus]
MHEIEEFRQWVAAEYGLSVDGELVEDGRWHYQRVEGDPRGAKKFGYIVERIGDTLHIGFCDFKRNVRGCWRADRPRWLSPEEWREQQAEIARVRRERERAERENHLRAARVARAIWDQARPIAGDAHPYLQRKGVQACGLRVHHGPWRNGRMADRQTDGPVLLVPMRDLADGSIWNVQAIFRDKDNPLQRDKDFLVGGRKTGLCHWLGRERTATLLVAEGYATAYSCFADTGYRTAIAFDAGNLKPVALELRRRCRDAVLVVLADNDVDVVGNPGLAKAQEAADAVGGFVAVPPEPFNDFNDWVVELARGAAHG